MKSVGVYVKKPVEIRALQWGGSNHRAMHDFLGGDPNDYMRSDDANFYIDHSKVEGGLVIKTFDGDCVANIGEYIICGVQGEFYPCKRDIFEASYDKKEEQDE